MDAFRYYVALCMTVVMPGAFLFWFAIHPFVRFWRRVGHRVAYAVVGTLTCGVGLAAFLARGQLVAGDLGSRGDVLAAGIAVLAITTGLRVAVQRQLSLATMSGLPELGAERHREQKLLTEGPYAHMRHPRYAQVSVALLGWALVANHLSTYAIALAAVPVFYLVAVLEERELVDRFGDAYRRYQEQVPRFFPRLRRAA